MQKPEEASICNDGKIFTFSALFFAWLSNLLVPCLLDHSVSTILALFLFPEHELVFVSVGVPSASSSPALCSIGWFLLPMGSVVPSLTQCGPCRPLSQGL